MEFKDIASDSDHEPQFEIILDKETDHSTVLIAIGALAMDTMTSKNTSVNPNTAGRIISYLMLGSEDQMDQILTYTEALSFARLIHQGAVNLPEITQQRARDIAQLIEHEVTVRSVLGDIDRMQPEDFV